MPGILPYLRCSTQPPRSRFHHEIWARSAEWPHLLRIDDPATLRAELAVVRERYNGVRLHAGIGYVTPNDEHEGRGPAIRKARQAGLEQARLQRLAWHREHRQPEPPRGARRCWLIDPRSLSRSQKRVSPRARVGISAASARPGDTLLLAITISVCLLVVVGESMALLRLWSVPGGFLVLAAIALLGVALPPHLFRGAAKQT
jgi:hypothetical protein